MAGTLTIPNRIGAQPGGLIAASKFDDNWTPAITNYVNSREVTFGPLASRPAPGVSGRYWYATDTGILYTENGANWFAAGGDGAINPATFGVSPGSSASDNRMNLQAAVDALPAEGGILQFTQYGIHIDAQINVGNRPILILGPGTTEVSTPGTFVLYLDTMGQTGFNVTSKGPFALQSFSIFGAAMTAHVLVSGPGGALKGNVDCRIDNCVFYGGAIQVDLQASIFQRVTRSTFWNYTAAGCRVQNLLDGDQGDSAIDLCVFQGPQLVDVYGVLYLSGGGLKITNCKLLGNDAGIAVSPTSTATDPLTISDLIIAGNSIEAFRTRGIFLTRTSGALVAQQIHIVNNQISRAGGSGTNGIEVTPGGAAGDAYIGLVVSNNFISQLPVGMQMRKVNGAHVTGNVFALPGGTVFSVDASVSNLTLEANSYYDYTVFMAGTPGARSWLHGGNLVVADLPPTTDGSTSFAIDALGPGDVGFTAFGMAATPGGTGVPVYRSGGGWKVG